MGFPSDNFCWLDSKLEFMVQKLYDLDFLMRILIIFWKTGLARQNSKELPGHLTTEVRSSLIFLKASKKFSVLSFFDEA